MTSEVAVMPDFYRNVHCILGLPFDAITLEQACARVRSSVVEKSPCFFSTPNLNFLIAAQKDPHFRFSVINSDLSVVDGMPVVWIARLLGIPVPERVAGSDMFNVLRKGAERQIAIFFFGGPEGVAQKAAGRINDEGGGLACVGFLSPGFGSLEEMSTPHIINQVNESGADFLIVSLGAQKGQAWIQRNRSELNVPVISHLGAVVNFAADQVSRAPGWMQKTGFEWLWRIRAEPTLWRRYFNDGLALASLLVTNVIPLALQRLLPAGRGGQQGETNVTVHIKPDRTLIVLSGSLDLHNLTPVRGAFHQTALAATNVEIDLTEVKYFDSAFLGLLILLFGLQRANQKKFVLLCPSTSLSRIIRLSRAGYLLESS